VFRNHLDILIYFFDSGDARCYWEGIARSVAPNSSAPASDVIAPPSNPATTPRRPTGANSNSSGLHSFGIGAFLESCEVVLAKQLSLIRTAPVLQLCEISGLGDQTGNEFQRDLNYRGFVASPVIGTPQGLAVYQNGVRVNEVFGDIVNWDFIPETAINRMTMMPSNPVYGLNALGGALAIDMKNGFTYRGTDAELRGGSFGRRGVTVQTGGQAGNLSAYLTADAINDNGWRDYSPSQLRRRSRRIIEAYDDSSSSNALASFRSGVSKPSVNQP
jgi:hypothetical protein